MAFSKVGVLSPVLFCIYIDGLLTKLSEAGFGCYMGDNFLDALGYADDIVLIAPSPSAMRKLLTICDWYDYDIISDYDIIFNADKSQFIVFSSAGTLCSELRSRMNDAILDNSLFLLNCFANNKNMPVVNAMHFPR